MKKLLPILFILIISSCSTEVSHDELVTRNGITYEINSNIPFTGNRVDYHPNRQLKYEGSYVDGKSSGKHNIYYENGILQSEIFFDSQVVSYTYYESGKLMSELYLLDNFVKSSFTRTYYENGNPHLCYLDQKSYSPRMCKGINPKEGNSESYYDENNNFLYCLRRFQEITNELFCNRKS